MHSAPGSQSSENISDSDGEARLWTQPDVYWPRAIHLWMEIARRYIDNDWIVGYNLLNEPLLANESHDVSLYYDFCVECTDSIRTIDPDGILFIDGDSYGQDFSGLTPPWDDEVVYSFHCYPPVTWDNPFDLDAIVDQYGTPIWHGETGEWGGDYDWYTNSVNHLENYDPPTGWAWWTHKKFDNTSMPYSINVNSDFQDILDYWDGSGSKPDAATAKTALIEQAKDTHSDSCDFLAAMVSSLGLDPNGTAEVAVEPGIAPAATVKQTQKISVSSVKNSLTLSLKLDGPSNVSVKLFGPEGKLYGQKLLGKINSGSSSIKLDGINGIDSRLSSGVYYLSVSINGIKSTHSVFIR